MQPTYSANGTGGNGTLFSYEVIEPTPKCIARLYYHQKDGINYVPKHWHLEAEILCYMSTEIVLWLNGKTVVCPPGTPVIVNSGDIHGITPRDYGSPVGLSVIFPLALYNQCGLDCSKTRYRNFPDASDAARLLDALKSIMEIYNSHIRKKDEFYQVRINSNLYWLFYLVNKEFMVHDIPLTPSINDASIQHCCEIISYVSANYHQDVTLKAVSEFCHISQEHLCRMFKKYMGITFKTYLTQVRLLQSCMEIVDTDRTLMQIAMNNGFPDYRSFEKAFLQVYAQKPAEFRRRRRNDADTQNTLYAPSIYKEMMGRDL